MTKEDLFISALNGKVSIDQAASCAMDLIEAGISEQVACAMASDAVEVSLIIAQKNQPKLSRKYILLAKKKRDNVNACAKIIVDYIFDLEKNGVSHDNAVKCGELLANGLF